MLHYKPVYDSTVYKTMYMYGWSSSTMFIQGLLPHCLVFH